MRSIARCSLTIAAALAIVGALASPASAHTGLQSSDPGDGAVVEGPIAAVSLDFSGTPTALDDGIIVADAAGNSHLPVEVIQEGDRITARFDPPLTEGSYALAWAVRSDDTHTIDGSISFVVIGAPPPTEAPATIPATTIPATTIPAATIAAATIPATTTTTSEPLATTTRASTADDSVTTTTTMQSSAPTEAEAGAAEEEVVPVAAAVEPPTPPAIEGIDAGERTARIGRLILYPAGVTAVGALAFAGLAFAGRRSDLRKLLVLVRGLGGAVAVGAALELAGLVELYGSLTEVLERSSGAAAAARVLAGVLLLGGISVMASPPMRSLSSAVVQDRMSPLRGTTPAAWLPRRRDLIGIAGAAVLVISSAFDGHTVSEGPRLIHAVATVAHVGAASVWAGGVVALAVVIWCRHRDGTPSHATEMIVRFSSIAAVSVAVAGAAGLVMAWFIVDSIGVPSTEWGRRMFVKVVLVGVALAIGGYNRFRLRPALTAAPDDPAVLRRARSAMTIEAVVLAAVALTTALLVAASTLSPVAPSAVSSVLALPR